MRTWEEHGKVQSRSPGGKGLRGLGCPLLLGGRSKDGAESPGPGRQLRGHSGIRGKSASFGGSRGCAAERVGVEIGGCEGRLFQKVSHPISNPTVE